MLDVNEPPVFAAQKRLQIAEDVARDDVVGVLVPAYDPDALDVLTYELVRAMDSETGQSVDLFTVHSCAGEIRIADNARLDFETTAQYELTVRVRDRKGLSAVSAPIYVDVIDVNELPTCTSATVTVQENSPAGTAIARVD